MFILLCEYICEYYTPFFQILQKEHEKENDTMGITSKKQENIPDELQPFPKEDNEHHSAPEFATIPAFDNSVRDPKAGVAIPTDEAVKELKTFMNVNKQ